MTQPREPTVQERKRPDAIVAASIMAANTPSGSHTPTATNGPATMPPGSNGPNGSDPAPRRRDSESGLNLKPSGRAHASSASALEDRSAQAAGHTIGPVAVENPVFSCKDVNVYYGHKHALKKVSIDVGRKQVLAMIGPSGCGKSTFLR